MVFWYKAEERPDFKLGDPIFWKHHADNYNNNEEETNDIDQDDLNWIQNKSKPKINVNKLF